MILGLVLTLSPNAFVNGLMYMLAAVLILGGVTQLMALVAARRLGSIPFGYWVMPSVILLVGLFVVLKPTESAELPLQVLGWCSMLYGVVELINALKIYRVRKASEIKEVASEISEATEVSENVEYSEVTETILMALWAIIIRAKHPDWQIVTENLCELLCIIHSVPLSHAFL